MKKYILAFIVICASCKKEPLKSVEEVIKDTKELPVNIDHLGDPLYEIKPDTIKLKNDYTLIIYPFKMQGKDSLNYRLVGNKRDTIFKKYELDIKKNLPGFDKENNDRDFKNHFILTYTFNTHDTYFVLYDKQSCKSEFGSEMSRFSLKWSDQRKELLIFEDCDDDYKKYIYDVNTKIKTLIDVTKLGSVDKSDSYRSRCDLWQNNWSSLYVKKINKGYYYLGGVSNCEPNKEFKIKIASQ